MVYSYLQIFGGKITFEMPAEFMYNNMGEQIKLLLLATCYSLLPLLAQTVRISPAGALNLKSQAEEKHKNKCFSFALQIFQIFSSPSWRKSPSGLMQRRQTFLRGQSDKYYTKFFSTYVTKICINHAGNVWE